MADREDEAEKQAQQGPLHGDILEAILSLVPLVHLLSASHVCSAWRRAASSLSRPSRFKPWLVVRVQSRRDPSVVTAHAYDPFSHEWIQISRAAATFRLRSSHSSLLYQLNPSELRFSNDAFSDAWQVLDGPRVWRTDPIVALVGSHVVVAGGVCDFEDDPLAVEVCNVKCRRWDTCRSMPSGLRGSASATWLSVAASDRKMYLMEKSSGIFCSFDPNTRAWEGPCDLRPDPSVFYSVIGFSGHRMVLVGLIGEEESSVEGLGVWGVDLESLECGEITRMPLEMVRRLRGSTEDQALLIGVVMAEGFVYVYDQSSTKDIFFCEFNGGVCRWGSVEDCDLALNDGDRMNRLVFTCVRVGLDDLRKAIGSDKQSFSVMKAGRQESE